LPTTREFLVNDLRILATFIFARSSIISDKCRRRHGERGITRAKSPNVHQFPIRSRITRQPEVYGGPTTLPP